MWNWLREYLDLKYEYKSKCESCEVLKQQLAIANIEKDKLLNRLLEKPTVTPEEKKEEKEPKVIRPHVPWAVQRQMIEAEDRKKAELIKKRTEELEGKILNAPAKRNS